MGGTLSVKLNLRWQRTIALPLAVVVLSLAVSSIAQEGALAEESIVATRDSDYRIEEELVVQGTRDTIKRPGQILRGYDARNMGGYYYKLRMYGKAYPYLVEAAQEGFKLSQARLGYIYQKGLGGVKRDWTKAVGWLGVASSRYSHPEIMNYWKNLKAKIPEDNLDMVEEIVEDYVSKYGSDATGVSCDINRRAGTHIAYMRCLYDDEIKYRDPGDLLGIPGVEIDTSVGSGAPF